ncbi:hypothetical protein RERY_23920 [Rhodococcus erythropolis]|nr:hypothetical protein RERY_23920 [Rhodococcus erythropolis]OQM77752.1 hypothetical protein B0E55_06344 [Rhodococcus sp. 66b]
MDVLATGEPIGTTTASGVASQAVTTSTSAGPYQLCRLADAYPLNRRTVSALNASPATKTRRTDSGSGAGTADMNAFNIDGTKCTVVTRSCAMVFAR